MDEEEFIKKNVRLSNNARVLVSHLKDFDFDKFVKWWVANRMIVGDAVVLEYLLMQRIKEGTKDDN